MKCVSYSYQMPYVGGTGAGSGERGNYAATGIGSPEMPVMADKNPFFDAQLAYTSGTVPADGYTSMVALLTWEGAKKHQILAANAQSHGREAQNVLYVDCHTSSEKRPDVGVQDDNIYTPWASMPPSEGDRRTGFRPDTPQEFIPLSPNDAVLVNDVFEMNLPSEL